MQTGGKPLNQDNFTQNSIVNQFIQQFNEAFAPGAKALGEEAQMQIRSALTGALQKMNLVTREEFDTQQAVLARSREKLDTLEAQISALEETLKQLTQK
jgi:BMFP domain-containing protein YqiC